MPMMNTVPKNKHFANSVKSVKIHIDMVRLQYILGIAVLMMLATASWGDTLRLEGEDNLSGTFLRLEEGVVVFKTALSGQIMAPTDAIELLTVDALLLATFTDGSTQYGKFLGLNGETAWQPLNKDQLQVAALEDFQEALPIPAPEIPKDAVVPSLEIIASTGMRFRDGVKDRLLPMVGLEITAENKFGSLHIAGETAPPSPNEADAYFDLETELRGPAWWGPVPYLNAQLQRDADRAVRKRSRLTLGLAQQLLESDSDYVEAMVGLGVYRSVWQRALLPGGIAGAEETDDGLNVQLGLRYAHFFREGIVFDNSLNVYPSFSSDTDWLIDNDAAVTIALTELLGLRFNLRVQYEEPQPYPALRAWDTEVGASLRLRF